MIYLFLVNAEFRNENKSISEDMIFPVDAFY